MAVIKIKKIRSEIKRPADQKKTLLALGLKKIGLLILEVKILFKLFVGHPM